jgi:4-amino-4-deoxy-L-arabinose transferase-like glycosyltransferase
MPAVTAQSTGAGVRARLIAFWDWSIATFTSPTNDWTAWLARIERVAIPPVLLVLLAWFVLVVPEIGIRGFQHEEGKAVAIARAALEDGQWLEPHFYGWRMAERPWLLSWLIALLAVPFGAINHWVARAPTVVSLLALGVMVFWLVRPHVSRAAMLVAVACLFLSPMIVQRPVMAEPDILLTALLFAAFCLWWSGQAAGQVGPLRWIAVGIALAIAAYAKGPQPVAYFTLGVGAFLLVRQQWRDLPGFFIANALAGVVSLAWYVVIYRPGDFHVWFSHSHITPAEDMKEAIEWLIAWVVNSIRNAIQIPLELLPGLLLVVPPALAAYRTGLRRADPMFTALLLYALCTTVLLIVWPTAKPRYAMPALPAVAVMAGLVYDRLRVERRVLANLVIAAAIWLGSFALVRSWLVMTIVPDPFRRVEIAGRTIAAAMSVNPAPLYSSRLTYSNNLLAYVPGRIRDVFPEELLTRAPPFWALVPAEHEPQLRAVLPQLRITRFAVIRDDRVYHLLEMRRE